MTVPVGIPLAGGGRQCLATFVDRPNRFVAVVQLPDGTHVRAHVADRGRLVETLIPGCTISLVERLGEKRATNWQAAAAQRADGSWASLDTLLPNRLMKALLTAQIPLGLPPYTTVRSEVAVGESRFDFVLDDATAPIIVEVKSAGRLRDGVGIVPDAPSARAARHVTELAAAATQGRRTALVVVAQGSVDAVAIDGVIDPVLATAVQHAAQAGVQLIGISTQFDRNGLYFQQTVPFFHMHEHPARSD